MPSSTGAYGDAHDSSGRIEKNEQLVERAEYTSGLRADVLTLRAEGVVTLQACINIYHIERERQMGAAAG